MRTPRIHVHRDAGRIRRVGDRATPRMPWIQDDSRQLTDFENGVRQGASEETTPPRFFADPPPGMLPDGTLCVVDPSMLRPTSTQHARVAPGVSVVVRKGS